MRPLPFRARISRCRIVVAALLGGLVLAGCVESNPEAEQAALAASEPWLALLDAGDYPAAWRSAAPLFREREEEASWLEKAERYRQPLGAFESRQLQSTKFLSAPWNAPAGAYAVVVFDSRWERGAIQEIVYMQQQEDGRWLAAGYDVAE